MSSSSENKNWNNSLEYSWHESLAKIKNEIDAEVFSAYLKPLKYNGYDANNKTIVINAPSSLIKNHIVNRFSSRLNEIFEQEIGSKENKLLFSVETSSEKSPQDNYIVIKKTKDYQKHTAKPAKNNLNQNCSFSNFVVGPNNEFAYGLIKQLINGDLNQLNYNPLFLYGGVGLGKTHLLHAFGHAYLEKNPEARVYYTSSENFTNKLIVAIQNKNVDKFKKQIRSIDLLLIDDIQFLANKPHTQEEFYHTFNTLHQDGKIIVIAADKLPNQIANIDEKLKNRFAWGITADLRTPDYKTRTKIIKTKAACLGIEIPDEVCSLIANSIETNIRELEGGLNRLLAAASLRKEKVTMELAQNVLHDFINPPKLEVSVKDIKLAVARHYGIKASDLESKRRLKTISVARQTAVYLIRKHTAIPYVEIGMHFGGRDHSSIIYSANKMESLMRIDEDISKTVKKLEGEIFSV